MNEPIADVQQSIFRSKVQRGRDTPPGAKIAAAAALFDDTVALMRDAIASSHPGISPDAIQAEVLRRLRIARRLDDAGIYRDAGSIDEQP